ncbi:MAG: alpha/beta hydrolase [Eubacteriales bacterium]|nr:alpha/beta hydrolase [Eubacteriales bacterium]
MKAKTILLLAGGLVLAVAILVVLLLVPVRASGETTPQQTQTERTTQEAKQEETPMIETKRAPMPTEPTVSSVAIPTTDELTITADLYWTGDATAPFILLFHQADYSRGEYQQIAPKLNALGYNCLAIDQRSGGAVNGVKNDIYQAAKAAGLQTGYTQAYPDLQSALDYVEKTYLPDQLIVWGSSYSASLALILASEHPNEISAVLAFSPGEYFKLNGKQVSEYAANITQPAFITSAKSEEKSWRGIADQITSDGSVFFVPEGNGRHGSSALFEKTPNNAEYWTAVEQFLASLK